MFFLILPFLPFRICITTNRNSKTLHERHQNNQSKNVVDHWKSDSLCSYSLWVMILLYWGKASLLYSSLGIKEAFKNSLAKLSISGLKLGDINPTMAFLYLHSNKIGENAVSYCLNVCTDEKWRGLSWAWHTFPLESKRDFRALQDAMSSHFVFLG